MRRLFRWPPTIDLVWLAMPLFVVAIRTLLQPVTPEDYWFALAFGDAIRFGELPTENVFVYTIGVDTPWYDQAWLAQWLMAVLAEHVGHVANYAAHILLLLAAWLLLLRFGLKRGAAPVVLGIAAAATHYMAANGLMVRSQMFAYPLFVAFLGFVLSALDARDGRLSPWFIPIVIVWANVHGTFVLAPMLCFAAAAGVTLRRWRAGEPTHTEALRWWGTTGASMLLTLVSPGTVDNLLYPLTIATATKGDTLVVEWVPPAVLSPQGGVFWLLLVVSIAFAVWKREKFSPAELLVFVLLSVITVTSVRSILWWGFGMTLIFTPRVSDVLAERLEREDEPTTTSGIVNTVMLATMALACSLALPGAPLFVAVDTTSLYGRARLETDDADLRVFSAENPVELTRELVSETDGPFFHHQHAGGLLEYHLVRKHGSLEASPPAVFIDQRIELTTTEQWQQYFDISAAKPGWERALDSYGVRALLLHPSEQAELVSAVEGSDRWTEIGGSGRWRAFLAE